MKSSMQIHFIASPVHLNDADARYVAFLTCYFGNEIEVNLFASSINLVVYMSVMPLYKIDL